MELDQKVVQTVTAQRVGRAVTGYARSGGAAIEGLGGGFRYCTLGEPLFDENGRICRHVTFADLARHLFFAETGEPLPSQATPKRSALLGCYRGTAYYLLFNGVLGDKRVNGGNVLTGRVLEALPPHAGPRVIFGEGCRLGSARLKREGITFKQIPYEIKVT